MFRSRTTTNIINKAHEQALTVLLNDHTSDFKTLLQNNNDVRYHHKNFQTLLTEIFKIKMILPLQLCDLCLII